MHPALRSAVLKYHVTTQIVRFLADKTDIKLPPEPTTCCMSGCANCVWIEYAKEISKLLDGNSEKATEIILNKISDPNLKVFLRMELKNMQFYKNETTQPNQSGADKNL